MCMILPLYVFIKVTRQRMKNPPTPKKCRGISTYPLNFCRNLISIKMKLYWYSTHISSLRAGMRISPMMDFGVWVWIVLAVRFLRTPYLPCIHFWKSSTWPGTHHAGLLVGIRSGRRRFGSNVLVVRSTIRSICHRRSRAGYV